MIINELSKLNMIISFSAVDTCKLAFLYVVIDNTINMYIAITIVILQMQMQ